MSKLVYVLIIIGAGIAAFGANELMAYGWDSKCQFEIGSGIAVIVGALVLSGLTRWR